MRYPLAELALASLAVLLCGTVVLAPPSPWLASACQPLALGLSGAWSVWCLARLARALAHRRAWTQNRVWILTPEALARQEYS